jgi:hypothetical protein
MNGVGQAKFFERNRGFAAVGGRPRIKVDHV